MQATLNGVVALGGHDEVCRDELGALVQQLEEGMLSICRWFSEENWAGSILDVLPSAGNRLSIGLHRELLEICGEAMEVLIEPIVGLT